MTQTLAILGANSQIARDLIRSMAEAGRRGLLLYVRDVQATCGWLSSQGLAHAASVFHHDAYDELPHDAVLNFVGVGDPRRAAAMGTSIFEVTQRFDDMALAGLVRNPGRRYVFLSSGAVYGNAFDDPVAEDSNARLPINAIGPQDWYAMAKLHAEIRHRARPDAGIIDLRVFNYFSRTQDLAARFLVTDLIRAIREGAVLRVSADRIVRDFLHPEDFHQLVERVLTAASANTALDCYSVAPVDKPTLLQAMVERFGLRYELAPASESVTVNATGAKPCYFSLDRRAQAFGYVPAYSSLDGVLAEASALIS